MTDALPPDEIDRRTARVPRRRRRRFVAVACVAVALAVVFRPASHVATTIAHDVDERVPPPPGFVDDASRLERTRVFEVVPVAEDAAAAEAQLVELVRRAARDGLVVSVAGARHSMGGHTIAEDGIVVDMRPLRTMELDVERQVLRVGAGAIWHDVIRFLDPHGLSPAVMQSNDSFTVGGSVSVNCHGWQHGRPPIASTVRSLRVLLADGRVVRASRDEEPELFSLVLGGYGLFGIVLEAELDVVRNERYRLERRVVRAGEALGAYDEMLAQHPDTQMAFARMNVERRRFLDDVVLYLFHPEPAEDGSVPELADPSFVELRRAVLRGSVGSEYGKRLRWEAETEVQPLLQSGVFSRNQLLDEGVETFENRTAATTDVLHEYFVPRAGADAFVARVRELVQGEGSGGDDAPDLLNVTVRSVERDDTTFLRYADGPMLSFVMLFVQERTDAAETAMRDLTRELVDAALEQGGRHYLPYRLHATREQFERAYPTAPAFFAAKRRWDPDGVFGNAFLDAYGR
ncbi:MAG: FAD-binding oxidoreductase [Planctomycetota bacterium]